MLLLTLDSHEHSICKFRYRAYLHYYTNILGIYLLLENVITSLNVYGKTNTTSESQRHLYQWNLGLHLHLFSYYNNTLSLYIVGKAVPRKNIKHRTMPSYCSKLEWRLRGTYLLMLGVGL